MYVFLFQKKEEAFKNSWTHSSLNYARDNWSASYINQEFPHIFHYCFPLLVCEFHSLKIFTDTLLLNMPITVNLEVMLLALILKMPEIF